MIVKALIDSSIWISSKDTRDVFFQHAYSVLKAMEDGEIKEVYITNYILLEVTNFLLGRHSFRLAQEAYTLLTTQTNIIFVDEVMQERIKKLYEKYTSLSLADCSLIVVADDYKIDTIFSLDSGFDKTNIVRKEGFNE